MRAGVRLGIDVGRARVGVAASDAGGSMAIPLETVQRRTRPLDRLVELVDEYGVFEVVVGLPLSLSGAETASTTDARDFATELAARIAVPVRLVDERLSTVTAMGQLHATGKKAKGSRAIIDQQAAVVILSQALDIERASGNPPGALVTAS